MVWKWTGDNKDDFWRFRISWPWWAFHFRSFLGLVVDRDLLVVNWYRNSTRDISWTYTNSFIEGVVVAKKDFDAPKHDEIDTKNLFVIKALQSLTSKGYVKTQFSWQYYYYTLTDEGVEFLRNELNIPEGILPLTRLKGAPAERPQRASRGPRRDGDSYRRRARD